LPAALRAYGDVSFVSPTDIWALGRFSRRSQVTGNRYAAMHWNGKSWGVVSLGAIRLPSPAKYRLGPIMATGPRDLWVIGNLTHAPFLLHWAGSATGWSRVDPPAGTNTIDGIVQDGHGGLWLYAYREDATWQFDHYNARTWTQQPSSGRTGRVELPLFDVPDSGDAFGLGGGPGAPVGHRDQVPGCDSQVRTLGAVPCDDHPSQESPPAPVPGAGDRAGVCSNT
jgi:hypothetical protein